MKTKLFLVCVVVLMTALFSGCKEKSVPQNLSTISVLGTGTVLVEPDIIQLTVSLSNVARTTQLAQEAVSRMVRQTLTILTENNIEDKNINTASLVFRTEYDYSSGRRTVLGQRAEQIITFSVDDIKNDSERVSAIIDRLIQINGIELNQINFSVKDNTEYFVRSRELAFQKAVEKANQYAELSGLTIIKVLSISEESNQFISPISNRAMNQVFTEAAVARDAGSTIIPTGELEITTRIFVDFILE